MLARAFTAIYPSDDACAALALRVNALRALAGDLRWERPEQWHLTLCFHGRVDDEHALIDQVTAVCAAHSPFRVQLRGSGAFPRADRARVLWCGVDGDAAAHDTLDTLAHAAGYRDPRPFRPHVTLARTHHPSDVHPLIAAFGTDAVGPPFVVERVVVMSSETRPEGARHSPVASVALTGG